MRVTQDQKLALACSHDDLMLAAKGSLLQLRARLYYAVPSTGRSPGIAICRGYSPFFEQSH